MVALLWEEGDCIWSRQSWETSVVSEEWVLCVQIYVLSAGSWQHCYDYVVMPESTSGFYGFKVVSSLIWEVVNCGSTLDEKWNLTEKQAKFTNFHPSKWTWLILNIVLPFFSQLRINEGTCVSGNVRARAVQVMENVHRYPVCPSLVSHPAI